MGIRKRLRFRGRFRMRTVVLYGYGEPEGSGSPYEIQGMDYSAFWVRAAQSRLSQSGSAGAAEASFQ